jgi:hypothetical protein
MADHHCLFCKAPLKHIFADLGTCPPSNSFLTARQCEEPEAFYPLKVYICEKCLLAKLSAEKFSKISDCVFAARSE